MNFDWLKRYVPRGIYGRAALILVLPVVTLQLVVSVVFIQRHFEGVTTQMTDTLVREVKLVMGQMLTFETAEAALKANEALTKGLQIDVVFLEPDEVEPQRRWYDFSGLVITRILKDEIGGVSAVQLPDDRVVHVFADTHLGLMRFDFDRRRVSASNPHQLLVNMVFFGGLMTVIAYIYLRNQLRPITRLATAAEAFGRGHKSDYRPAGATEIRAAGQAFLDMRAKIERQIEQRTLMLSGVSHDLRTPLTRLRLGLSFLSDEERAPMERDVDDMQRMLDEFLAFSKDASEGQSETTDIGQFIGTIVEISASHGVAVTIEQTIEDLRVPIRRMAVQRAVENLITNAVRYGKTCEVRLSETKRQIVISVEDDGPGIPADQREEALRPFARLDAARNQNKVSGVGLGLAITADAARAHGGRLELTESAHMGGLKADLILSK